MSILDTCGRAIHDLRISVTDRCNFRCPYCMPADIYGEKYLFLPRQDLLTFEEITRVVKTFTGFGVRKIRLTGGEPLMRKGIGDLVGLLAEIDDVGDLALTTNGYFLPKLAVQLKQSGLSRISVSLDSLDDKVFKEMNGREYSVGRVLSGIKAAEEAEFASIKINVVVQRGINDHTLLDLVRHFRGTGHIVRFIEYMDVGSLNGWSLDHVVPAGEIISLINSKFPLESVDPNYSGEVANRYRFKDGQGEIGVIASVTKPFCGGCTRIRLATDGRLFTCLFGTDGTNLREPLRSGATDDDIIAIISNVWKKRDDRYSEFRSRSTPQQPSPKKIEMYQIGG